MLTSLNIEGMKKDQLHVENMNGVSPYFNKFQLGNPDQQDVYHIGLPCELTTNIVSSNGSQLLED